MFKVTICDFTEEQKIGGLAWKEIELYYGYNDKLDYIKED